MSETPARNAAASHDSMGLGLRRRLVSGSAWVLTGRVAGAVISLVVSAVLARLLSSQALGAYFLAFSTTMFAGTIATFGFDRAVVRFVSVSLGTGRAGNARAAIRHAFAVTAGASVALAGAFALGLGELLADHVLGSPAFATGVTAVAAWLIAMSFQKLIAETYRGFQDLRLATLFDGLLANSIALSCLLVIWSLDIQMTFARAVFISAGAVIVSVAISGYLLIRRVRPLPSEGTISRRQSFSVAWPLLVTNVAIFSVGSGIDLWIVGAFGDPSDVALYGAASRLVFLVATPLAIISYVVPPFVAQLHAQQRPRALEHVLRSSATLAAIPAALVLIAFLAAGGAILGVIYGDFYMQAALVLGILASARLFAVFTGSCGVALMMTGHERTMMAITVLSGLGSVAAGVLLGWQFGMVGVAMATASGIVLQNGLQLLFARRRLGIWTHARLSLQPVRELLAAPSRS